MASFNPENVTVNVTDNNIKIFDSYKVSKKDFKKEFSYLREKYPTNNVLLNRKDCSLKLEWATHNFLYDLGIKKDHTKDVDLNYPIKWYAMIGYFFCGIIALIFIS